MSATVANLKTPMTTEETGTVSDAEKSRRPTVENIPTIDPAKDGAKALTPRWEAETTTEAPAPTVEIVPFEAPVITSTESSIDAEVPVAAPVTDDAPVAEVSATVAPVADATVPAAETPASEVPVEQAAKEQSPSADVAVQNPFRGAVRRRSVKKTQSDTPEEKKDDAFLGAIARSDAAAVAGAILGGQEVVNVSVLPVK